MDLVLKLREIRRMHGLTQKDVARLSGVGQKTITLAMMGQPTRRCVAMSL